MLALGYYAIHVDPLESKFFPFLAYGLPYIVLVNLISSVFCFFIKSWKIGLLNTAVILVGYPYISRLYAFGSDDGSSQSDLTIVSYNVRAFNLIHAFELPKEIIRDSIFKFLHSTEADIFCFQEFYHDRRELQYVNLNQILNLTKTKHIVSTCTEKKANERYYGCFLFSKHPIIDHGLVEISTGEPDEGKCVYADIQHPDGSIIRIYNFHLASIRYKEPEYEFVENISSNIKLNDENKETGIRVARMFLNAARRRSKELDIVLNHAKSSPYPTVLCGDLNDTPTSNAYHKIRSLFLDAFQQAGKGFGKTYSGRMPSNRIDYIFHSKDFQTLRFEIQHEVLSDHRAIKASLKKLK
jgi:endonuclease/exonuclease/phosphatase family metal-dependent hydrolase